MSGDPTLCFVGTTRGNAFMNELLGAVAHEVAAAGMRTEVVLDTPPLDDSRVYVLVPHEYFATVPEERHPTDGQLARTIAFCTEQPGTPWFDVGEAHARRAAAVVDINRGAVRELRRLGVLAEHFRLGYSSFWDTWHGDESRERPTDVLFLGAVNERRLEALAGYAATLWPHESHLLIPPELPKTREREDFLLGESKWQRLRSAKILLNLHRQPTAYFEWVRVLESIANGCVVVSEHSTDCGPLVPGEHFVSGSLENLALLADGLLRDEEGLAAMRSAAYDVVREELPMRPAAERLIAIADVLARSRRRHRTRGRAGETALRRRTRDLVRRASRDPRVDAVLENQLKLGKSSRRLDAGLKRIVLGQIELSRRLATQEVALRGEDPHELRTVARTASYARARPRVSVLIPLYNHAQEVRVALDSVAASEFQELEVVVLDDASSDGSLQAVLDVFVERPFVPAMLLQHRVNRGLGRTRNDLVGAARGEYVFMLDADNEVYPTALARLVRALDGDRAALFAYPMLEVHADGVPETLRSFRPWEPRVLLKGNYIDAMALLRRKELLELGGYAEDLRLYGWEDYDLWCRYAERSLGGALVPQILTRYRRAEHSMLATTDLDTTEVESLLRARYPSLAIGRSGQDDAVSAG
jgi:Glycosyl transferase family 2/Glycosyl transferases group 1